MKFRNPNGGELTGGYAIELPYRQHVIKVEQVGGGTRVTIHEMLKPGGGCGIWRATIKGNRVVDKIAAAKGVIDAGRW